MPDPVMPGAIAGVIARLMSRLAAKLLIWEDNMHAEVGKMSPLQRAFLNAVFQYHRDHKSEIDEVETTKAVFRHIKAGNVELAAIEAGKNPATLEIFEKALGRGKGE